MFDSFVCKVELISHPQQLGWAPEPHNSDQDWIGYQKWMDEWMNKQVDSQTDAVKHPVAPLVVAASKVQLKWQMVRTYLAPF